MEGIYAAYVTGADGFSVILFVLLGGRITGADVGGVTYHGEYSTKSGRLEGALNAKFPPHSRSITGYDIGPSGESIRMNFSIEFEDIGSGYIRLDTPLGPVSAAVSRLEALP